MTRTMIVLALVLGVVQVAEGQQGQVVSYYVEASIDRVTVINEVPFQGFVLTDIAFIAATSGGGGDIVRIVEVIGQTETTKHAFWMHDPIPNLDPQHFNSGISFTPGARVDLVAATEVGFRHTLSGYIPVTPGSGAVPAVSSWGVGVMALLVVGVATVAFRRRAA